MEKSSLHLSDITENNIVILTDFYANHSTAATARFFNCKKGSFIKFLIANNIEMHSEQLDIELGKKQRIETNILKYGVPYPAQLTEVKQHLSNIQKSKTVEEKAAIQNKRDATNKERYGRVDFGRFGTDEYNAAIKEKYNVDYASQASEIKEKTKQTCLEKYGVESFIQTKECRKACIDYFKQNHDILVDKRAKTNLAKYGNEVYTRTDDFKDKSKQTCLDKYGVENPMQADIVQEHLKQTILEKYGVDNVSKNIDIKNKKIQTSLANFGVEHPTQTEEIKNKIRAAWSNKSQENIEDIKLKRMTSCINAYGVPYYTQTHEYLNNKHNFKMYSLDDIFFDSFPELCFYLYNKSLNNEIFRNKVRLSYDFNGETHYCFPDFAVNGELIEIKGDHLYKKMLIPNTLDNAKLNCLLQNNVKILLASDYKKYIDWFNQNGYKKSDFIVLYNDKAVEADDEEEVDIYE